MTVLVGTVILDGRYLTLENLAVKTTAIAGALVRVYEGENAPYLTLRGCRLEAAEGERGTALLTLGPVWLELTLASLKGESAWLAMRSSMSRSLPVKSRQLQLLLPAMALAH